MASSSDASITEETTSQNVQRLIRGEMRDIDFPQIQQLEHIKTEAQLAYASSRFNSPSEQALATCAKDNVIGWVDTAGNCFKIAAHMSALAAAFISQNPNTTLPSHLLDHGRGIYENTKQIYTRAIEQAISSSAVLLSAIEANNNTKNNPAVQAATLEYTADVNRYKRGEVDMQVPKRSHEKLVKNIEQAEPNPEADVRKEASKSTFLWKVAAALGGVLLLVGAVVFLAPKAE